MSAETYEPESKNLLALSVLLYYQSRGLKQDVKINETVDFEKLNKMRKN